MPRPKKENTVEPEEQTNEVSKKQKNEQFIELQKTFRDLTKEQERLSLDLKSLRNKLSTYSDGVEYAFTYQKTFKGKLYIFCVGVANVDGIDGVKVAIEITYNEPYQRTRKIVSESYLNSLFANTNYEFEQGIYI